MTFGEETTEESINAITKDIAAQIRKLQIILRAWNALDNLHREQETLFLK